MPAHSLVRSSEIEALLHLYCPFDPGTRLSRPLWRLQVLPLLVRRIFVQLPVRKHRGSHYYLCPDLLDQGFHLHLSPYQVDRRRNS